MRRAKHPFLRPRTGALLMGHQSILEKCLAEMRQNRLLRSARGLRLQEAPMRVSSGCLIVPGPPCQECVFVPQRENYTILLADDDEDDAFLVKRAVAQCHIVNPIQWVKDGTEAVTYLTGEGKYSDRITFPFPELIILDVKMPRMSGLEVLAWLRDHPDFRVIPTIIMSSSSHNSDVRRAYDLGANTYFVKPGNFDALAKLLKTLHQYWEFSIKPEGPEAS